MNISYTLPDPLCIRRTT